MLIKFDNKHQVIFTSKAFLKMQSLVMTSTDEICWHGLCKQLNSYSYLVYDILVHPQTVTGATVRVDDAEYAQWMNELTDEEFNNMKFEGHSHVKMGVEPSNQDIDTEAGIASTLPEGGFYIFVIMNQKMELKFRLYKKEDGIVYNTTFTNYYTLLDCGTNMDYANNEIKNKIKKKTYSYSKKYTSPTKKEKRVFKHDVLNEDSDKDLYEDLYEDYYDEWGYWDYYKK